MIISVSIRSIQGLSKNIMINFPRYVRTSSEKTLSVKGIEAAITMNFISLLASHLIGKHIWPIIGVDSMKAFFPKCP